MTCKLYQGPLNPKGYGVDSARVNGEWRAVGAHRTAYCHHHNINLSDISGKVIRHTCDVRDCINPDHLIIGTQQQNIADMVSRGRQSKGEQRPNCVLTQVDVDYIRSVVKPYDKEFSQSAIARRFGVTPSVICRIVSGKKWAS